MTPMAVEAEYWAYHYQESKATVEFDDDDEGAAAGFLAQAERDWDELEKKMAAEKAANGDAPAPSDEAASDPVERPTEPPAIDPDDWGPEE